MKNNHTNLHVYEDSDIEDYRSDRIKRNPNLMRGVAVAFTITLFALGLIAGSYRAYMALFPPR